jgi:hypothetical protein
MKKGLVIGCVWLIFMFILIGNNSLLMAQQASITVEGMSQTRLNSLGITGYVSTGQQNVGIGEYVYLSAQSGPGAEVTGIVWSFDSLPDGSEAAIEEVDNVGVKIRVDLEGEYIVRAAVTTASGTSEATKKIIANMYKGAGGVGGVPIVPGECATCHSGLSAQLFDAWKESRHATLFKRGIDGEVPNFTAGRIRTSTTGISLDSLNSGSFGSLMREYGWEFPTVRVTGNFDSLVAQHPDLAQVATIGCESCHGAGSFHITNPLIKDFMQVSYEANSCNTCHHNLPNVRVGAQWERAGHSNPIWSNSFRQAAASQNNSLQNCVRCHDGRGYVNFTKGKTTNTTQGLYEQADFTAVTCQACHEPHSAHLRKGPANADTLASGYNYSNINLGAGATCADCHKYRYSDIVTVEQTALYVRWGTHYAGAANVLLGEGGYEFGFQLPRSVAHLTGNPNTCVDCHMAVPPAEHRNQIGEHTKQMRYTPEGGQEVHLVAGCTSCHGAITSFDDIYATSDYDMDGEINPFQQEVQGLLDRLAMALPPLGEPTIDWQQIDNDDLEAKGAFWNYLFVRNDHSLGIHNPKYVVSLLQRSITLVTGVEFEHTPDIPLEFALGQNYPNPFNPTTRISFSVPEQSIVLLEIFDIAGRKVTTLVNEGLNTGTYHVVWDGRNQSGLSVSSGIYLYRIQANNFVETKRMVFVK